MSKQVKQIKGREVFPLEVGKRAYFHLEASGAILETSPVLKVAEVNVFDYIVETQNTVYEFQRFGLLTAEIIERVTTILESRKKSS